MSDLQTRLNQMPPERRLYTLRSLPRHLAEAGEGAELASPLTDFDFMEAKVCASEYRSLINDYDLALNPPVHSLKVDTRTLQLIQSAIRLSAAALEDDVSHLAGQLIGRLESYKASRIRSLLTQARTEQSHSRLLPLKASLVAPSGPLVRTFEGHSNYVLSLGVVPDGRTIVSGDMDNVMRTWNLYW